MLSADVTINRVRRGLILSLLLKTGMAVAALACLVMIGPDNARLAALLGIGAIWFWLAINSAKGSRAAAESPSLIAAGQYEEAERNIEQTVKTFSLVRTVKLQSLHHLALLRHAQRRWQEAAQLARALLSQRLGALKSLSKSARLLLADSLLQLNDLRGAYESIASLYQEELTLGETLNLLVVQAEYSVRVGGWQPMLMNLMTKIKLAELLPAAISAQTQACFALAARKVGRQDLESWLRGRVELLAAREKLVADQPELGELWTETVDSSR
jgi:hypothetical protein